MSHIVLRDGDRVSGVVCVDREIGTSIILSCDIDELGQLVALARAHKVPELRIMVSKDDVEELVARGWTLKKDLRVMEIK